MTGSGNIVWDRIETERIRAGLSQRALGRAIGASGAAIAVLRKRALANPEARPSPSMLARIAAVLGTTVDYLLSGHGTAPDRSTTSPGPTADPYHSRVPVLAALEGWGEHELTTVLASETGHATDPGDDYWWSRVTYYRDRMRSSAPDRARRASDVVPSMRAKTLGKTG